jgi:PhnB protein
MAGKVKPVPEGCRSVTPYMVLRNAAEAIDFYKKAFGASEVCRMTGPGGQGVMHAEIKIGDSMIFLSDEFPNMGNKSPQTLGATTMSIMLYVDDVDASFARAVEAGARPHFPPQDMFWGDRFAKLVDPFGHEWAMATHIEDVSQEEMARRSDAFCAQMAAQQKNGHA